jgi:hypothetical protein
LNQSQLAQVLQALSQQQAALLQAHADGMRLQRVLVEQMLEAGKASGPLSDLVPELTATSPVPDAVNSMTSLPATDDSASAPVVPPLLVPPRAVIEQHPMEAIVSAPLPRPEEPPTVDGEMASAPEPQGPELASPEPPVEDASGPDTLATTRAASTSRGRAARYFQAHPTRPARVVTPQELGVLRSVSDAGDAARLILQFGPHRGATLGQVAQSDPTYLRELALKAQRPTVRVATLKLVAALELLEQQHKRTSKRSSRPRPGAER